MRDLSYKFWDYKNDEMLYDIEIPATTTGLTLNKCLRADGVHPLQFTGVYDKYSKKIYEGDILRFHGMINEEGFFDYEHVVSFTAKQDVALRIRENKFVKYNYDSVTVGYHFPCDPSKHAVVIGNIYTKGKDLNK